MLKPFYVKYQGDLYEVVVDILGDIEVATVYRDNNNSVGERLNPETLPPEVLSQVSDRMAKWFKKL